MTEQEREDWLKSLTTEQKAKLKFDWKFWARPNQLPPEGDWHTWLILSGRGFGKTRTGSETVRNWVCGDTPLAPGKYSRIALVAETAADARQVMVEGESGILACHPRDFRPEYSPANRKLKWPNGAIATIYNATQPDQLRGPQHDAAWGDELAKWDYAQETWDQLAFGLRLGSDPRVVITTTPRPIPVIRKMIADPDTYVTRGSTFDNSDNLAKPFLKQIQEKYAGTRLGRQEIEGEILEDIPGALWNKDQIDQARVKEAPELERVIIAVDPATSNEEGSDENGIVAVGLARDNDGYERGYVLADYSLKGSPEEWAKRAVQMYREFDADRIVAEKNQGGDMVASVIRAVDRTVPIKLVHASRGKHVRAEPISALYEQKRIHHVGMHEKLEDQMCLFSIDNLRDRNTGSPDRVDALVWGLTEIFDKLTSRRRVKKKNTIDENVDNWQQGRTRNSLKDVPTGWMA